MPAPVRSARFDDPSLVSCAGLVPALALAGRAGLVRAGRPASDGARWCRCRGRGEGVARWSRAWSPGRTRSPTWTCCGTAGWPGCSPGCGRPRRWARSCGRSGSVMSVSSTRSPPGSWPALAQHAPIICAGEPVTYLDVDDTVRATFGYAKQGAGYGYTGVKGLNALLATVSTRRLGAGDRRHPAAQRLGELRPRRGPAGRRRDQDHPSLRACSGLLVLRADSAYYGADVIAAARRHGVHFSVTARKDRAVDRGDRRDPATMRGRRSTTRARSSTSSCSSGSATPRSPRCRSPPSPRNPSAAGHRAVDRAPSPRRQPRPRSRERARRTVPGLAPPRDLH